MPTLRQIADHVGLSPAWLQKRFSEALGVSPRQYADQRRRERLKSLLRAGDEVTGALYEAGYGSSSRLYESSDATLGMTPATYRRGGAGARIAWTAAPCALGLLLVAATERGICFVAFDDSEAALGAELRAEFPHAEIVPDIGILEAWTAEVLGRVEGRPPRESPAPRRPGDGVPAARVAGAHRDPAGRDPDLQRDRAQPRQTGRATRRRPGLRDQPGLHRHPLPPRQTQRRRPRRLPLGRGAEGGADRGGEGGGGGRLNLLLRKDAPVNGETGTTQPEPDYRFRPVMAVTGRKTGQEAPIPV